MCYRLKVSKQENKTFVNQALLTELFIKVIIREVNVSLRFTQEFFQREYVEEIDDKIRLGGDRLRAKPSATLGGTLRVF